MQLFKIETSVSCDYCGSSRTTSSLCAEGHFVCDECEKRDMIEVVQDFALTTRETDPVKISELLMRLPGLPMLGCDHALIAGASLAAALKNSRYAKITDGELQAVLSRTTKQSIEGYCAQTGVCGITSAIGACFSVFLDARFGCDAEQKIVMEAAIQVSQGIAALTGPSCCKAYVRSAIETASRILADRFGIVLPATQSPVVCRHSSKHPQGCREEKCPYYQKQSKDIFADSIHLPVTTCHS